MLRIKKLKLRSIWNRSLRDNQAGSRTRLKSLTTELLINRIDLTTFKTWYLRLMKRWISLNLRWIGIRKSLNSGPLLQDRRKKITWLLKNIEEQMRPRSRSLPFRLRNSQSKLLVNLTSLKEKLQKLKQLRLSLTKLLKNSNVFILKDISFIYNGRKPLKTQEREMSLSMKLVRTTPEPKTISTRRRLT